MTAKAITLSRSPLNSLNPSAAETVTLPHSFTDFLRGYEIIDALEFGSASAAMLVASHACSQDMPSVEAVKDFIKKEKKEYGEMIARV